MHKVSDIKIEWDFIEANREVARRNRQLFDKNKIKAIDIAGAIGSGKTTLVEIAIANLKDQKIGAIAGDVVASIDAARFEKFGIPVKAMNTGKECHLDAHLVGHALEELPLEDIDTLFIENVGNLICPTDYDLGAHKRVVVVSVSEGDDIVEKHPLIFRTAHMVIINKIDIAEYVDADPDKMEADARRINPKIDVVQMSAKRGINVDKWLDFAG